MARRDAKRVRRGPAAKAAEPELPAALNPVVAAALVFVASGAVLVLEILAVRLLAPYVGLTLETTTSIIGAVLAGIAVGAAVGGRIADRTNARKLIVGLLVGGGLLALLTVPLVRWLGPGARGDGDLAALGITLIALVPPAAVLSAVSPAVAHLQLHDLSRSGTIVGRLSAWATAGALLGTFGTGFVLVPLMPVSSAVLAIGAVLVLAGLVLGTTSRQLRPAAAAGTAAAAIALGALSGVLDSPCDADTSYHCASVETDATRANGRQLLLDDLHHSYVDLEDPAHLEYPYVQWMADAIGAKNRRRKPIDVVFIGGGGFTLPRWLGATRPGSHARVLEVDGELVDFVEDRLGLRTSPELTVTVGDARVSMLDLPTDSADVVVGDAFGQQAVPWHLTTSEWVSEVRRVLKPGGLYALNVIDLPPLGLLRAEAATLLGSFADVRMVAYPDQDQQPAGGNAVLLGSDRPLPAQTGSNADGALTFARPAVTTFSAGAQTLRDDDAPVDQLLTAGDS